jgi:hypothetical protein
MLKLSIDFINLSCWLVRQRNWQILALDEALSLLNNKRQVEIPQKPGDANLKLNFLSNKHPRFISKLRS